MKYVSFAACCLVIISLMIVSAAHAQTKQYEDELRQFKVQLSATDPGQVKSWLEDNNSGYPDLADRVISMLNHTSPRGNSTSLDVIMGKYRILERRQPSDYISPPYNDEQVKNAYIESWINTNGTTSLPKNIREYQNHYQEVFDWIVNSSSQR